MNEHILYRWIYRRRREHRGLRARPTNYMGTEAQRGAGRNGESPRLAWNQYEPKHRFCETSEKAKRDPHFIHQHSARLRTPDPHDASRTYCEKGGRGKGSYLDGGESCQSKHRPNSDSGVQAACCFGILTDTDSETNEAESLSRLVLRKGEFNFIFTPRIILHQWREGTGDDQGRTPFKTQGCSQKKQMPRLPEADLLKP